MNPHAAWKFGALRFFGLKFFVAFALLSSDSSLANRSSSAIPIQNVGIYRQNSFSRACTRDSPTVDVEGRRIGHATHSPSKVVAANQQRPKSQGGGA